MTAKDLHRYDDIINMNRPISNRKHMSMIDRAAQFSPFAALTGHEEAIEETGRLTDRMIELDENSRDILDEKLSQIMAHIEERPKVKVTYFRPDELKSGGSYEIYEGLLKKLDDFSRALIFTDGSAIELDVIYDIELITD